MTTMMMMMRTMITMMFLAACGLAEHGTNEESKY